MNWRLSLDQIEAVGRGLKRPECVLCTAAGHICCADWDGGVTWLKPNGVIERILAREVGFDLKPNSIALCRDGSFLVTDPGDQSGLYRLHRDGRLDPEIVEVEGRHVPPFQFCPSGRSGAYLAYREHPSRAARAKAIARTSAMASSF